MIKDIKDTKIPQVYSTGLYSEKGYDVAAEHTVHVLDVLVTGVSECLNDIKDQKIPVVFLFEQNNGEFIAAAIVEFIPNEDTTKPGNWAYYWTFNKEDLPNNSRTVSANDNMTISYFRTVGITKYGMVLERADYGSDVFRYLLALIKQWLGENALETEEVTLKYEDVVQFRVAVENGEKFYSIEVGGEIKQLIKSDDKIEVLA